SLSWLATPPATTRRRVSFLAICSLLPTTTRRFIIFWRTPLPPRVVLFPASTTAFCPRIPRRLMNRR
ncbi:hypothetical protein GGH99_008716, partial [Coemansia sp. RSA 1285]